MPQNIEIKARVNDIDSLVSLVVDLTDSLGTILRQEDTFFNCPNGRLKLRVVDESTCMSNALGVLGKVTKVRQLYMYNNTRIHLDEVEGLGCFMELEVVLAENQTPAQGEEIAKTLMEKLKIDEKDLISVAYMDLLLNNQQQNGSIKMDDDKGSPHKDS